MKNVIGKLLVAVSLFALMACSGQTQQATAVAAADDEAAVPVANFATAKDSNCMSFSVCFTLSPIYHSDGSSVKLGGNLLQHLKKQRETSPFEIKGFVCVKLYDPISSLAVRKTLIAMLGKVSFPRMLIEFCPVLFGNLHCPISRTRINNNKLYAHRQKRFDRI